MKTIDLRTLLSFTILSVIVWLLSFGTTGAAASRTEVAVDDGAGRKGGRGSNLFCTKTEAGLGGGTVKLTFSVGLPIVGTV